MAVFLNENEIIIPDEEKQVITRSKFKHLYDSNYPVRHYLETLDNIEEARIIHEALK